jgi:hypothetical protein
LNRELSLHPKKTGELKFSVWMKKIQIGKDLTVKITPAMVSPMKTTVELVKENNFQRINELQKLKISLFDDYGNKSYDSQSFLVFIIEGNKEKQIFIPENEFCFLCKFTPLSSETKVLLKHKKWKKYISVSFNFAEERKYNIFFKKEKLEIKISNFVNKFLEFSSFLPSQIIKTSTMEESEIVFIFALTPQFVEHYINSVKEQKNKFFFVIYFKTTNDEFEIQSIYEYPTFFVLIDDNNSIMNKEENRKMMLQIKDSLANL